jgi:CO/xanthine dehydrogenase Mo-binding subunit
MAQRLVGTNYPTPDLVAKITGRARYAEDFRADGMLFCKLMLSERPHARVVRKDLSRALALPGVHAILTAEDVPQLGGTTEHCLTNEPL